jgi:hypothetical protein
MNISIISINKFWKNVRLTALMIGALSWFAVEAPYAWADTGYPATTTAGNKAVYLGAKVGPNLATYGGEHADGEIIQSNNKLAFEVGGYVGLKLHPSLLVASEIALASRGTRIVINGEDVGSDDLKYLQIPVFVQAVLPFESKIQPYALVGAAFGILLSAMEESNQGNSTDIKDKFTSTDLSLLLGIGTHLEIGSRGAIILEARYMGGLRDVFDEDIPLDIELKNRAFSVLVGYQYRFSGPARSSSGND